MQLREVFFKAKCEYFFRAASGILDDLCLSKL